MFGNRTIQLNHLTKKTIEADWWIIVANYSNDIDCFLIPSSNLQRQVKTQVGYCLFAVPGFFLLAFRLFYLSFSTKIQISWKIMKSNLHITTFVESFLLLFNMQIYNGSPLCPSWFQINWISILLLDFIWFKCFNTGFIFFTIQSLFYSKFLNPTLIRINQIHYLSIKYPQNYSFSICLTLFFFFSILCYLKEWQNWFKLSSGLKSIV